MNFLKKLLGIGKTDTAPKAKKDGKPKWIDWVKDNPNAKYETRFWRNNRFTLLMNKGKIEHITVFMYLLDDDAQVSSPVRKKEKQDCQKQLKEMFGEIDAPVKFTTTDLTAQEYLKRQQKLQA